MNRATTARAAFWGLGTACLGIAVAALAASRMPAATFRAALAGIGIVVAGVVLASLLRARRRWADGVGAARWVEDRVRLDQRLLTWVSAREELRASHLWPVLEADNRARLHEWAQSRLDIPRVPASAAYLLLALLLALASLLPDRDAPEPPPEIAAATSAGEPGGEGGPRPPSGGGAVAQGVPPGDAAAAGVGQGTATATVAAAVDAVHADLARRFEQSIAASVLDAASQDDTPADGADDLRVASRKNAERGGVGQTKGEDGGRPPDASLARLEQDDGSGQAVRDAEPQAGASGGRPTKSGGGPEGSGKEGGEGGKDKSAGAGKGQRGGSGRPDGPLVASDAAGSPQGGTTGAGAGGSKATAALLAPKPLTLAGERATARFALTIGAGTRELGPGDEDGAPTQPRSRIANVARGEQAADKSVRHEEIPPEYEGVVKRIFAREP